MHLLFGRMLERRVSAWQNDLISRHCAEVQNIYKTMRGWRHDYHNHIQTLLALCGDEARTREYLLKLNDDLTQVDTSIKTGNVMVDAILGSKLSLIKAHEIDLNARATVPPALKISEIDLCVVIGNLLDNALEACLKQPGDSERFIRVFIGVLKGELYLSVANSMDGEIRRNGKGYISLKGDAGHGFGLARVDRIVRKYGGYLNRQSEDGAFVTEILLPL